MVFAICEVVNEFLRKLRTIDFKLPRQLSDAAGRSGRRGS